MNYNAERSPGEGFNILSGPYPVGRVGSRVFPGATGFFLQQVWSVRILMFCFQAFQVSAVSDYLKNIFDNPGPACHSFKFV